jgi:guanylate kinase
MSDRPAGRASASGREPTRRCPALTRSGGPADPPAPMLVIISGPSGVGKDTIIAALQRRHHQPEYYYVVTCTTRARRPNETEGVSYHFVSQERFEALRRARELLEANEVHGNWYGTPKAGVRQALASGQHAVLKIDVQGAAVVKDRVPDALLIFVVPPSLETLFQHLRARQTETADELEVRQRNAAIELARQHDYDYVVVNEENHVDVTAARIEEIIASEEWRGKRRQVVI